MGGLSLGPDGQPAQQRSYIPPHLRNRGGGPPQNDPPAVTQDGPPAVPQDGPPAAPQNAPAPPNMNGGPPMNGLNNSNWAGYVQRSKIPF